MLLELLLNFVFEPQNIRRGEPGYFHLSLKFINEWVDFINITVEVPSSNGESSPVTQVAQRIELKKRTCALVAEELQRYGFIESNDYSINSRSNRISLSRRCLDKLLYPLDYVNKIPQDHQFVEILRCFDLRYHENSEKVHRELGLIKDNQSIYFGFQQQGDDFIIFLKEGFEKTIILAALVSLISKKLAVSQESVFARCRQSKITLNRLDFAILMDEPRPQNPVIVSLQAASQSPSGLNVKQAIGILNHEVYKGLYKPVYGDREYLMDIIRNVFLNMKNLEAVCDLYLHITQTSLKERVDIHRNPALDLHFFEVRNTNGWQELLHDIREYAFNLLLILVGLNRDQVNSFLTHGQHLDILQPRDVATVLSHYCNYPIFGQHRGNSIVVNVLSKTQTVKNIEKLIAESTALAASQHIHEL